MFPFTCVIPCEWLLHISNWSASGFNAYTCIMSSVSGRAGLIPKCGQWTHDMPAVIYEIELKLGARLQINTVTKLN